MRLYEFIFEDVSANASLKNIVDILTVQMPQLYHRLTIMAEKMHHNKGELGKGFNFVAGGQKNAWYQDVYFRSLKTSLYNFVKSLPVQHGVALKKFLGNEDRKFSDVEHNLLPILGNIAKSTKNSALLSAVNAAIHAKNRFENKCAELDSGAADEESGYIDQPPPREKGSISVQNQTVEAIINDVLKRVDKKQAGEIRNAIARSQNKLLALQQELTNRNIKV